MKRCIQQPGLIFLHVSFDGYGLCAFVLICLAVAVRVALLLLGWPPLDSDEATIGLMGMHIAFRGEHPVFFYGQSYMGAIEAYLAALMFRLFGVSTFTLLIGLVLVYALFLAALYALTCLLYTRKLALLTLALLVFGSNAMLSREMVALGGYPETLLFGTLLLLLASWLALTSSATFPEARRRLRPLAFLAWGLVAGLGLWTHMLILPFLFMSALLLILFCWRELLHPASLLLLAGLFSGAAPLLLYNLSVPFNKSTLFVLMNVRNATGLPLPARSVLFSLQLKGAFLIALPLATGANPICAIPDIHGFDLSSLYHVRCTLVHTGWTVVLIGLWLVALCMSCVALYVLHGHVHCDESSAHAREVMARQASRLALLGTALLTFLLYVFSPDAAIFPVATSRYLIGLLVSTPALLWPLWNGGSSLKALLLPAHYKLALHLEKPMLFLGRSLVLLTALIFLLGTTAIFTGVPPAPKVEQRSGVFVVQVNDQHLVVTATRALDRQQTALVADLLQLNIHHLYSDYWTCNWLIFQSREQIICKVLKDHLNNGLDRYPPYRAVVSADPFSSYVFVFHSLPARLFAERLVRARRSQNYQHIVRDGYEIFRPLR